MWMLRVLKGPQQGLLFPLSSGVNSIGRSSSCSIKIDAPGISRNHVELHINSADILVVDQNSSNGTYINGVKIHKQNLETGDQVSIHKVVFDIIRNPYAEHNFPVHQGIPQTPSSDIHSQMEQAPPIQPNMTDMPQSVGTPKKWWESIFLYLEKIVLPGAYKLPEWMEFKWVIGLFGLSFIILAAVFSTFPMVRILASSIETESLNHAESIAVSLALENRPALQEGLQTAVSVDSALRRPGVKKAFIIKTTDGRIVAPVEQMNNYPKSSFIHRVRKTGQKSVEKVGSSTAAAMVPIPFFNPETSSQAVMYYSAVFYNMNALATSNKQTISLLIQSLFIALLLGGLFFFFLYKIITFPIENINEQLNQALKDQTQDVSTKYQFPALSHLCSNINSALERVNSIQDMQMQDQAPVDRTSEMSNLVELVGFACIAIQLDTSSITAVNSQFSAQTGLSEDKILHQHIDSIEDVPLQLNLKEALEKVSQNPIELYVDKIELNSTPFQVTAQGVYGAKELAYILVAFIPESEEA